MRVSKTVREYIEEQVARKFPKTENELRYEQNEKIANAMNKEYFEEVEKARLVGFFPGAGSKYRKWSPLNFAKAADFIKEKNN